MRSPALLLAALGLAARAGAGDVSGQIQLLEKGGAKAKDISDVVVFVDGARPAKPGATPATATMVMKAKTFVPHVMVVPVGAKVEFPNEDPLFHNAFSLSPENRFDLELYKKPTKGAWVFKAPGVVNVYCNIHPQMSAVVVVRDNPFFTKTGKDGSFTIAGVPAGKYVLVAWHERGGERSLEIQVPAEGQVAAELTLDGSKYKRVQHKNKFGKDYAPGERY